MTDCTFFALGQYVENIVVCCYELSQTRKSDVVCMKHTKKHKDIQA